MARLPNVGDIIEIPLPDGKNAYAQYVHYDERMGPLIQVYDKITDPQLESIVRSSPLFPPVITGLMAAVRTGMWKVVGKAPVENFRYPGFVATNWDSATGEATVWFLWDGEQYIRIGDELPQELRDLEYLVVWDPQDVVERIVTGEYPHPYKDLREKGSFIPRSPEP